MATAIFLSPEGSQNLEGQPDCDEASSCHWFETSGAGTRCANRNSMICHKRLKDVFAPHNERSQTPSK